METDKNSRLLYLYEMLVHGEGLQKKEAAARFGVNERSIQRDIDCLRNFFASQEPPQEILYKAKEQRYELTCWTAAPCSRMRWSRFWISS